MRIKYLKAKHWLLMSLGGLLGLQTSCMYGTPEAFYHIKGAVVNPEGEPVEGIRVAVGDTSNPYYPSDYTDAEGRFHLSHDIGNSTDLDVKVSFYDVDSTENGHYNDITVPVHFSKSDFHGGDGDWYDGTAERELSVTLSRK